MAGLRAYIRSPVSEIPLHLCHVALAYCIKTHGYRCAAGNIRSGNIQSKRVLYADIFASISDVILITVRLIGIRHPEAVIRHLGPEPDVYPSLFIYDTDGIFDAIIIYVIITDVADAIVVRILLRRVIGIWTVVSYVVQSITIIISIHAALDLIIYFAEDIPYGFAVDRTGGICPCTLIQVYDILSS